MSAGVELAREYDLEGLHCSFAIRKYSNGVVVLKIAGTDIGEFGDAPMIEMAECVRGAELVHLFIDAREVRGATMNVSGAWAEWLAAHRLNFAHITMLTGTRYVEITADFVRRFAALESKMRIYTEPDVFDAVLGHALSGARSL